jgi:prepilin-type N-terminal cleavage/methylation domain-containing protein
METGEPVKAGESNRDGFTLIEVMIALVILTGALLGMGAFMTQFAHSTTVSAAASQASDLAVARIETIKGSGDYSGLEDDYEGTTTSSDHPGYSIATEVERVKDSSNDYTIVTATVTAPALDQAVSKSTIISAF